MHRHGESSSVPGPHRGCEQPTETLTRHVTSPQPATLWSCAHKQLTCTYPEQHVERVMTGPRSIQPPPRLSPGTHTDCRHLGPATLLLVPFPPLLAVPTPHFTPPGPPPPPRGLLTFPQLRQLQPALPLCPLSLPCRPHTAIPDACSFFQPIPGAAESHHIQDQVS